MWGIIWSLIVIVIVCGGLAWAFSKASFLSDEWKSIAVWGFVVIGVLWIILILVGQMPLLGYPHFRS